MNILLKILRVLKIVVVGIICLYTTLVMGQQPKIITLEESLEVYIYNTINIEKQKLNYENILLEYDIFKKSFLPTIEFEITPISYNHSLQLLQNYITGEYTSVNENSNNTSMGVSLTQKIAATGGTLRIGSSISYLRESSINKDSYRTMPLYINYTQQLFGGRKTYLFQRDIKQIEKENVLRNYCSAITEEEQQILSLYLNAYTSKINVDYYKRACCIGDTLLEHAKLRKNNGKISEYEFNQLELKYIDNQISLERIQQEFDLAVKLLENELRIPQIEVCKPDYNNLPKSLDEEMVMIHIKNNNPIYLNSELQKKEAQYSVYTTKLNNSFNANISMTYGMNKYSHKFNEAYNNLDQMQNISISLAIPVFQWGSNQNKIKIAQNQYEAMMLQQSTDMLKFDEKMFEIIRSYNRCAAIIEMAEKRYELSKRQFEYATKKFDLGKISAIELSSIENEQLKAKQEFLAVQIEYYTMYYQIRHYSLYDYVRNESIMQCLFHK